MATKVVTPVLRKSLLTVTLLAAATAPILLALAPAMLPKADGELPFLAEWRRPAVWISLQNTLRIAAEVVVLSTAAAIPLVLLLKFSGRWLVVAIRALIILPVIANPLAIILAWYLLLRNDGMLVAVLRNLRLVDGHESLLFGELAVVVVMSYLLGPYLVIVLDACSGRSHDAVLAARSLGATRLQAFFRLEFPRIAGGYLGGSACVGFLALGYFVTPALLGGTRQTMLGQLIVDEVNTRGDLAQAASYGLVLVVTVVLSLIAAAVVLGFGNERT